MKHDRISIKWKIAFYFVLFAAIMLVLLWLFQIVFLNSFYKSIKTQNIKSCAESIISNVDNDSLQDLINQISSQNDVSVRIVDSSFSDLYTSESTLIGGVNKLTRLELYQFYLEANAGNGTWLKTFPRMDFHNTPIQDKHLDGLQPPNDRQQDESMMYVRLITRKDGSEVMLLLNSIITPINSTVETLRVQLIFITGILLLLSLGLSVLISRKISKPIIIINNSAKELAKGNYQAAFEGKGYREIDELNTTLNFAAVELSKVEELRRELIANISHDLRTPLTMITGYSEMMRDIPGENTPENVQVIIDEATRLSNLVTDLLDLSKLQSGTQTISRSTFNLTAQIRGILKRYAKLTEQDGYSINLTAEMDVYVEADEIKISQVIYNLINNAINYAGEDKTVLVRQVVEKDHVRIEISDNGAGIAPDKLDYIWDRYYKVPHKRAVIGTGLGLSIVKSVLDMHGAQCGVTSEQGKGSTFWFILPTIEY